MNRFIKWATTLVLLFPMISCNTTQQADEIIFNRIEYIYNLKSRIDQNIWPEFSDVKLDVPLVYYADSVCYVANPTVAFLHLYNPKLVYENNTLKLYKTALLDSVPFHMATEITLGDSTTDYNYNEPYMNCSSPELTGNVVTDVHTTELWSTMVMHEYFHGFQFKHPGFLDFYTKNVNVSADTLKVLYQKNDGYKNSVDEENDWLLKALNTDSKKEIQQSIQQFFEVRAKRHNQTRELLNSDIITIEEMYETMEGTARYVEYSLYSKFATMQPDHNLIKSDSLFQSYQYFKDYSITNDKWLYLTGKTYYYATGFNMVRLLDKLGVNYKSRLFNEEMSIVDILREQNIEL